jgi:hypothetical protein
MFSSVKCFGTNSESLLLFLFHGTEFRVVFSFTESFRTEFREFACFFVTVLVRNSEHFSFQQNAGTEFREFSVPRNSQNSIGNDHLFHLFHRPRDYFFLSEIPNPTQNASRGIAYQMHFLQIDMKTTLSNSICFFLDQLPSSSSSSSSSLAGFRPTVAAEPESSSVVLVDTSSIGILGDDSAEAEAVAELEAAEAAARAAKKG